MRCLRYLPRGVYVRFDGFNADLGAGCGVVLARPVRGKWKFNAHCGEGGDRVMREVSMWRIQIPLAPEKERTVQTAQGMTMDAAKIFLTRPGTMSHEDWWFHVYVMLSHARKTTELTLTRKF